MKEIYNIILELNQNNSSNYKQEVLTKYKDSEKLKKFLFYVYNPRYNYYITELPETELFRDYTNDFTEEDFYLILNKLRTREITGNKAKDEFASILSICGNILHSLYSCVIDRDIKANVSTKTLNKVLPNWIPEIPYSRCSKLSDFKQDNFFKNNSRSYLQKKLDGVFNYIIKKDNQVSFLTRNGTEYFAETFNNILESLPNDMVLVGEALIKQNGKELDRKTGNGLINKFIKAEATLETLERNSQKKTSEKNQVIFQTKKLEAEKSFKSIEESLCFELWNILSVEEFENGLSVEVYSAKLAKLENIVQKLDLDRFKVVDTFEVSSLEEANEIANRYITNGFEGGVLKSKDYVFENKTSKLQIKIKSEKTCELKVIGVVEGEGKFEGKIGSLICTSSCGGLVVNVGSGFTDSEREMAEEDYLDKIVTVKYNERIKKKDSKVESLFLPIFLEIRIDKNEADKLGDIE